MTGTRVSRRMYLRRPTIDDGACGCQQHERRRAGRLHHAHARRDVIAKANRTAQNSSARSLLLDLPSDLFGRILALLDPVDQKQLRLCSKGLHKQSIRHITRLKAAIRTEDDVAVLRFRLSVLPHLTHLTIRASGLRTLTPVLVGPSLPARIFPILRDLRVTLEYSPDHPPYYLLRALRKATALSCLHVTVPCTLSLGWAAVLSSCPGLRALSLRGLEASGPSDIAGPIFALTALRRLELDSHTALTWQEFWRTARHRAVPLPPLLSEIGNLSLEGPSGHMSPGDAGGLVRALAQLPRLEKLHVLASRMDSALAPVLQQGRLVELHVDCWPHTPPWLRGGCPLIPALPKLTRLQALKVEELPERCLHWEEFCAAISHASALTRLELLATGLLHDCPGYLWPELLAGVTLPWLVVLAVPLAASPTTPPGAGLWQVLPHGMPALRDLSLTFVDDQEYGGVVGRGSGLTCLTRLTTEVIGGRWRAKESQSVAWPPVDFAISNTALQSACLELCVARVKRDVRLLAELARACRLHACIRLRDALPRAEGIWRLERSRQRVGRDVIVTEPAFSWPWENLLAAVWERDLVLGELPGLLRRLGVPKEAPWTVQLVPRTVETEQEFGRSLAGVVRQKLWQAYAERDAWELSRTWIPVRVGIQV